MHYILWRKKHFFWWSLNQILQNKWGNVTARVTEVAAMQPDPSYILEFNCKIPDTTVASAVKIRSIFQIRYITM